jgi:hypothetical protein
VPCDAKLETCTGQGANKEPRLGNGDQAQTAPAEKEALKEEKGTLNSIGNILAKKHTRFVRLTKDDKTSSLRSWSDFPDAVLWNNVFYDFAQNVSAPEGRTLRGV